MSVMIILMYPLYIKCLMYKYMYVSAYILCYCFRPLRPWVAKPALGMSRIS